MDIQVVRDDATEKLLAIYEIEADTLKICVAVNNKGRPKKFESKAGSGHRFFILKRIKKNKGDAAQLGITSLPN